MSAIKLEQFGGMLPAWDDTLLPAGQSASSVNGYLFSGALTGWRQPKLLRNLTNSSAQFVFRIPKISKATATDALTVTTQPNSGDTVTVDEETYKFTATVTDAYDVLIGSSVADSAANLLAALTVSLGEGLLNGTGTVANPAISIITADNTLTGNVITLKAPDFGAQYNSTTVAQNSGGRMSWATPTFTGGTNAFSDNRIDAPSTWLEFLDQNTMVMKSPVVGDSFDRYYAASPSLPPQYNPRQRIEDGKPWWLLGVPAPGCAPGVDVTGGGATAKLGNPTSTSSTSFHLNANTAYLLPITPTGAMSLNDVTVNVTGNDNLVTNLAALLYSDNNGIPGTLLNTGQVTTPAVMIDTIVCPFLHPPGLTSGVQFWIGVIADGGIDIQLSNDSNLVPPGPAPIGYTFKTPFTAIPGAAPPVDTPVKVTTVTTIDLARALFWVNIDTALAANVARGDVLSIVSPIPPVVFAIPGSGSFSGGSFGGSMISVSLPGAPSYVAFDTANAGATAIQVQIVGPGPVPGPGWTISDLTNPGAIKGGAVGGVSPPIKTQPNLNLWGDLSTQSILAARAYVYTYVTEHDEESAPSPPTLINGWVNGTWTISLFTPPPDDMGKVRNIKTVRLYRTVSGSAGNTVYYWVADVPVGTATYSDPVDDSVIALNNQMPSTTWFPPPAGLIGFLSMPNGMVVGWKGNELWFCEPYRPHAWPVGYVLTTEFPIVGIGVTGQAVMACTSGDPYVATGSAPSSMSLTKIKFPEPCVARNSVVSTSDGVYYQSPNGLIKVTQAGVAANTTELWITREKWKKLVPNSSTIQAIMQSSCYFAFGTQGDPVDGTVARRGYTIEINPADAQSFTIWPQPGGHRIGFGQLTAPNGYDIVNVLVDTWTGVGLLVQNGQVYYYDFTDTAPVITPFKWRSKTYQSQARNNFAAMRVFFDIPPGSPALNAVRNEKPTLDASWNTLASDQYGIVRVYADDVLVTTREIRRSGELLRILAGFKADQLKFEFEGRVVISNVQIATSVKELAQV